MAIRSSGLLAMGFAWTRRFAPQRTLRLLRYVTAQCAPLIAPYALVSPHRWQFETELLKHRGVVCSLGCLQDFDADKTALGIVVHDNAVRDLFAVLDRAVGQIEIDRVRSMI